MEEKADTGDRAAELAISGGIPTYYQPQKAHQQHLKNLPFEAFSLALPSYSSSITTS